MTQLNELIHISSNDMHQSYKHQNWKSHFAACFLPENVDSSAAFANKFTSLICTKISNVAPQNTNIPIGIIWFIAKNRSVKCQTNERGGQVVFSRLFSLPFLCDFSRRISDRASERKRE